MKIILRRTCLALCAGLALAGAARAQQQQPVKIGVLMSMTGGAAGLGAQAMTGINLAVHEINTSGGLLGHPVQLVIADDQSDPTISVNEANRLVFEEKIDALIGPALSQFVVATMPILTRAKKVQITLGGTTVPPVAENPSQFSMMYGSDLVSRAMVDAAADVVHAKRVAIMVDNGAQAKSAAQVMKQRIAERGLILTGEQSYEYLSADVTPQLLGLRRGDPDLILLLSPSPTDTAHAIAQRADIGWDIPMLGSISLASFAPQALKMSGPAAFNKVYGLVYPELTWCAGDATEGSNFPKYVDRLRSFDAAAMARTSALGATLGYDAASLLAAAIRATNTTDGPRLTEWIEANADHYHGTTGFLSASKTAHYLIPAAKMVVADQLDKPRADGLFHRFGCGS